mmetsp:Transcript_8806/g.12934  ORF Transcript_8806/g.12934 Transcript_8806/m.12934 type:complete len:155 (+) Transcript_8806:166-630(+)|eukprot:CAMPEP_0197234000 /NCGR_PEP_ID=MMETSP1429-20130617/1875_1 /TAXON_ID=49237 /ORGANISM="Chaetoceros  sp., Strain UNC1202" /LENGTH=154 /DNA_ID=CAMNT_0042692325 /DNA_START=120 /DNA_END=584 /DNA_ORIENTATION=+
MTWHDPNHTGGAIFVNKENLLFALPLILLCSAYAYFILVPLNIGLSLIGAVIVIYRLTSGIKTRAIDKKEEKIANLDENLLKELAADEMLQEEIAKKQAAKKKSKAGNKAKQRIAAQKKKEKSRNKSNGGGDDDDDDDDGDLSTFVKKSNKKRK